MSPRKSRETPETTAPEPASHRIEPVVWFGILILFCALAFALRFFYQASFALRAARLHDEVRHYISAPENLDMLVRGARYRELLDPGSSSAQNAVAVLRLVYNKQYSRALRKAQVRSYARLEAAGELQAALSELIEISAMLRAPASAEPAASPPSPPAEASLPEAEAQAPAAEEAVPPPPERDLERELLELHEKAVALAKEGLLELARPEVTLKQQESYETLRAALAPWGYLVPELP